MSATVRVTFDPPGLSVEVPPGTTILEAAWAAGVNVLATCAGRGTCGNCAVRLLEGDPGRIRKAPRAAELPQGMYLACLVEVETAITVQVLNFVRLS
ncbi:MAG: 2Fe-2S iron-sulfur cluster binding domain-containing protein [Actinobacteria bacterium]|nr:MAG: 2Fe-2S iron-sulfur cluster binding domain-containing protein [Actinomycetota bacterium]